MWKKIEQLEDFSRIKNGDKLLKYTGQGEPDKKFNIFKRQYRTYFIKAIRYPTEIDLTNVIIKVDDPPYTYNFGTLNKKISDMIQEKIWWRHTL